MLEICILTPSRPPLLSVRVPLLDLSRLYFYLVLLATAYLTPD